MPENRSHTSHVDIIKRLKRAEGHMRSIVSMIEAGRSCVDIAQQMHAVEKAIQQAKRTLIHDHLDHCLESSIAGFPLAERQAFDEFKAIAKFL
jgi:uncharacterized protein